MLTKKRGAAWMRVAAVILVVAMLLPVGVSAAAQPRASQYLRSYSAYTHDAGGETVQVGFAVNGVGYLDLLGASVIKLYESEDGVNWSNIKTYNMIYYPSMIKSNATYHSGHVDYHGESGMYYKAYVTIFGISGDEGDSRNYWTTAIRLS